MYEFRDVNETSEGGMLPSEALSINGEYIENQISGYRTLNVTGREALSPDVVTFETGVRDGSKIKSKKFPERIITVKYQLISESNEAFREAYNKLASILNVEEAELIFNDEQDKFFVGTPCIIGAVTPGLNSVIGEFEILCADPFKYSVVEYEAEPDTADNIISLNYNGTYKAFPTLEAEFFNEDEAGGALSGSGDCGYVAFFNENEKIIQLGNPDETDTESYAKSQTLVNQKFMTETAWSNAEMNWATNSGKLPTDTTQLGNYAMAVSAYLHTTAPTTSGTLLTVTSKSAAPNIKYTLTAQTSGRTEKSVNVKVTIVAALEKSSNYFGRGFGLKGSVKIGSGDWNAVTIKSTSAYWKGSSGHTVTLTIKVKDLTADTNLLEDIKFKVERTDSTGGKSGILDETACDDLAVSKYTAPAPNGWYLSPQSFGTNTGWHGPAITRTIPADAAGDVGAKNFTFSYNQKMAIGHDSTATQEIGGFQVMLTSGSGADRKIVAGVCIRKSASGNKATLDIYFDGKKRDLREIDLSLRNRFFGDNYGSAVSVKTSTITKNGRTIIFNIAGLLYTFVGNSNFANATVNEITFVMERYGTKPPLTYNGLYWAKFVKNNCDTWADIPNKFSANDVISADCKSGEIKLNDTLSPALGALGNDWEDFYLTPGLNQIGFSYSSWVDADYAPKPKVRYREVFL